MRLLSSFISLLLYSSSINREGSIEVFNDNCGFVYFLFQFYQFLVHIFFFFLDACTVKIAVFSWCNNTFVLIQCPSGSLVSLFALKSTLSGTKTVGEMRVSLEVQVPSQLPLAPKVGSSLLLMGGDVCGCPTWSPLIPQWGGLIAGWLTCTRYSVFPQSTPEGGWRDTLLLPARGESPGSPVTPEERGGLLQSSVGEMSWLSTLLWDYYGESVGSPPTKRGRLGAPLGLWGVSWDRTAGSFLWCLA